LRLFPVLMTTPAVQSGGKHRHQLDHIRGELMLVAGRGIGFDDGHPDATKLAKLKQEFADKKK